MPEVQSNIGYAPAVRWADRVILAAKSLRATGS
jgi:hypothetical protein